MYLRSYRPTDLEALFQLDLQCFEVPFRFSRRMMRQCVEEPNAIVRLLCEPEPDMAAESLLGVAVVQLETVAKGRVAYLVTLDVAPGLRRRGLGRRLLACAEEEAETAGAEAMLLHVFTGNKGAIALYEGLGYRRVRLQRGFYSPQRHAFVYRKELAPGSRPAAPLSCGGTTPDNKAS